MRNDGRAVKVEVVGHNEAPAREERARRVEEEVLLLDLPPLGHGRVRPLRAHVREEEAPEREEVLLRERVCAHEERKVSMEHLRGHARDEEREEGGRTADDEPRAAVDEVLQEPDDVDALHLLALCTLFRRIVVERSAHLVLGLPLPRARSAPVRAHGPHAALARRGVAARRQEAEVPVVLEPVLRAAGEAR